MKPLILMTVGLVPFVAFTWVAGPAANPDDAAIRASVQHYFDGMMQANPELLKRAFHPDARLIGPTRDGGVQIIPFERWATGWQGRQPRQAATHTNRVVTVDLEGVAATAKTELVWPDVRYVDYLSLLKVNGEWKIVNKIWTEERR